MGCPQSILSPYEITTAISESTCRSTYGPRRLTSIPTTTRITTSSTATTERPLQWSTSSEVIFETITTTEQHFVVVTQTATPSSDGPTSTYTTYVSSTSFGTVDETVWRTATAPAVTITPAPYTVPAPIGVTPIASNPAKVGANTFTGVRSSTTTEEENQPVSSGTEETSDTATEIPGRLLLAPNLHIRAEKSFSNVNRVICDETTRFITTSFRPFTVRHSTITRRMTIRGWVVTTLSTDIVSTTTETHIAYEEVTATLVTTDLATSLIYETMTVTPTQELSELPRSTVYAACAADNIIGGIGGYGIAAVRLRPLNRPNTSATPVPQALSIQSCCEACILETERSCSGSVWFQNSCFHIITDQCNGSEAVNNFYLSVGRKYADFEGMILSNGLCGQQIWSGGYCEEYDSNCGVDPPASAET